MRVVTEITEMQGLSREIKKSGRTIGFVPTMGFLHEGHLSLMRTAVEENDMTVASIFVNPTQFGPGEDFETYPRDLSGDAKAAGATGVDVVFAPTVGEMYPQGYGTFVEVQGLTDVMCGASRPGHFRGVTTVVSKLFDIVLPDRAYFGQKDAQQALVIRRMALDLNFPLEVVVLPTVREEDGLAMSSRNSYLSESQRQAALVVPRSLNAGKALLEAGERGGRTIAAKMNKILVEEPAARVDYIAVVDPDSLEELENVKRGALLAVAVWIGSTRLIDNLIWGDSSCFVRC